MNSAWLKTQIKHACLPAGRDLERIYTDNEHDGIMTWRRRNAFFIKCVSIILVFAFIYQDIVNAQGGVPIWATKANGGIDYNGKQVNGYNIPHDLGSVQDGLENGGDEVIINIQDAHSNFGAQKSIANILDSLVSNYNVKLVAIEGSEGYIDTTLLQALPDKKIKEEAADYLMKQGRISAGEFFSIMSEKPVGVYGIENSSLYVENVKAFRKTVFERLDNEKNIDGLINSLEVLREHIYSKELLSLSKKSLLNKEGKIPFGEYWDELENLSKTYNISYGEYRDLSLLARTKDLEKDIDFEKANNERKKLIDVLSKDISKPDLESLVLKSVDFKLGKLSAIAFHTYLLNAAEKYGAKLDEYKDLVRYTEYTAIYDSVDIVNVFNELNNLEKKIKKALFSNDEQKKLDELLNTAYLLKDLFLAKLSDTTYSEVKTAFLERKSSEFADFIKENYRRFGLPLEGNFDITKIFENVPDALEFYRLAEERNNAMFNNTLKRMREKGEKVAALVTGGFHTEGLTDLFRQNNLSYMVVVPKFDADSPERPYIAILTNKTEPYEEMIKKGDYLALYSCYSTSRYITEKLGANELDTQALALARAFGRTFSPELKDAYLEKVREMYESLVKAGTVSEGQAKYMINVAESFISSMKVDAERNKVEMVVDLKAIGGPIYKFTLIRSVETGSVDVTSITIGQDEYKAFGKPVRVGGTGEGLIETAKEIVYKKDKAIEELRASIENPEFIEDIYIRVRDRIHPSGTTVEREDILKALRAKGLLTIVRPEDIEKELAELEGQLGHVAAYHNTVSFIREKLPEAARQDTELAKLLREQDSRCRRMTDDEVKKAFRDIMSEIPIYSDMNRKYADLLPADPKDIEWSDIQQKFKVTDWSHICNTAFLLLNSLLKEPETIKYMTPEDVKMAYLKYYILMRSRGEDVPELLAPPTTPTTKQGTPAVTQKEVKEAVKGLPPAEPKRPVKEGPAEFRILDWVRGVLGKVQDFINPLNVKKLLGAVSLAYVFLVGLGAHDQSGIILSLIQFSLPIIIASAAAYIVISRFIRPRINT